jgi:hypothetical protein
MDNSAILSVSNLETEMTLPDLVLFVVLLIASEQNFACLLPPLMLYQL